MTSKNEVSLIPPGHGVTRHNVAGFAENTALALLTSIMVTIIFFGSVGNFFVILAVAQVKKLQSVSNIFVVNLSVCDLLFVTAVLPANVYTYLTDVWSFNPRLCKFVGFLAYTLTGTTIMTITLIAWNRYQLVVSLTDYKRTFCRRNIYIMIVATWALPMLVLQPAVFEKWGHFDYIPMLSNCNLALDESSQSFKIFLLVIRAAIPSVLIIYYYTAIYTVTKASHRRLRSTSILQQNTNRQEMRLTRMMVAIFIVFACSYFPCTISSVIDWSRLLSKTFHKFCQTTVFLGSAVNPLLYGFMNEQFRRAYYQILTCAYMSRFCPSFINTGADNSSPKTDTNSVNTTIRTTGIKLSKITNRNEIFQLDK